MALNSNIFVQKKRNVSIISELKLWSSFDERSFRSKVCELSVEMEEIRIVSNCTKVSAGFYKFHFSMWTPPMNLPSLHRSGSRNLTDNWANKTKCICSLKTILGQTFTIKQEKTKTCIMSSLILTPKINTLSFILLLASNRIQILVLTDLVQTRWWPAIVHAPNETLAEPPQWRTARLLDLPCVDIPGERQPRCPGSPPLAAA